MNKEKAIIFDIDGTLSDDSHRIHHINKIDGTMPSNEEWHQYHSACIDDEEYKIVSECCRMLYQSGYKIILITGRDDDYLIDTKKWLENRNIYFHELYMRVSGDHRSSVEIKSEIYENEIKNRYEIIGVFEDRARVVKMWREKYHLMCLQTKEGNY